ncbi:MAG: carotenoid oxygenase family protein [Planctomycetota bacterium]|nr:carotenoid oxygenase family protein [Planctomycetota bacterium]
MAGVAEVTRQWNRVFEDLKEEHAPRALKVTGRLPSDLVGSLYRVGPSCFSSHGHPYQTLFDGDGAVSRVRFDGKGAEGSVRFVEGPDRKEEAQRGKALYSTFGTKSPSRLHRVGGRIKNGANTSLLSWQGKMFALFEGGLPTEISPDDLRTLGENDLEGQILQSFSAHPHYVPQRRAFYNYGVRFGPITHLDLYELPMERSGAIRLASLPLPFAPLIHDFIATENYLIFLVPPVRLRVMKVAMGLGTLAENFQWKPREGTEVIVVPIDDPQNPVRFRIDPFFLWHFSNAFEERGKIVLDVVRYEDFSAKDFILQARSGSLPRTLAPGLFHRMTVDLKKKRASSEPLSDWSVEFPRVAPGVESNGYQYSYLASHSGEVAAYEGIWDQLVKLDVKSGRSQVLPMGSGRYPSEPIFIPREGGKSEDDGWLVSLVYDQNIHKSSVVVVDGRDLEGGPVAEASFDQHIPFTFHGLFTSGS